MKSIVACRRCKKLFERNVSTIDVCPVCQQALNRRFKSVRDYVRDNKGAGLNEVSEACEVDVKQLIRWVREERLFFAENSKVALPCLECGTLITYGEYCDGCKRKMLNSLKSVSTYSPSKETHQMKSHAAVMLGGNNRIRSIR